MLKHKYIYANIYYAMNDVYIRGKVISTNGDKKRNNYTIMYKE